MRRVLQPSWLSGLLVTVFVSTSALAEEPADIDAPEPAEGTKSEPPRPAAPAPAAVVPALAAKPEVVKPAVGDVSVHGYLRAGFGAGVDPKGRAVCFGLQSINGSLKSKYRLGNECELWAELMFSTVVFSGDNGVVGNFHFMPVAFIPTTEIGYHPAMTTSAQDQKGYTSTGATVAFPNAYADLKGIPWLHGGTAWAGSRYYKRESVYISDFFYWNPSGLGLGIEDAFRLGSLSPSLPDMVKDMSFSYAAFAVDGTPSGNPYLPAKYALGIRNDLQIRGFRPFAGAEFQLGFQYILDWSRDTNDAGDPATTYGGWGVTLQYVQDMLGGNNKLAFQYGRGGGTGFGTLARFYYPDFSLNQDTSEWRFRVVEVLTIQPFDWLGAQVVGVFQRDANGTPNAGDWFSYGGRVSFGVVDNLKLLLEGGRDEVHPTNNSGVRSLFKGTGAVAFAAAKGFWARPEIRVFYTWATWTNAARVAGVDSGGMFRDDPKYANYLSGSLFGVQAEAMW